MKRGQRCLQKHYAARRDSDLAIAVRGIADERAAAGPALPAVRQTGRYRLGAHVAGAAIAVGATGGNAVLEAVGQGQAAPLGACRVRAVARAVAAGPSRGLAVRIAAADADPGCAGVVVGARSADGHCRDLGACSDREQRRDREQPSHADAPPSPYFSFMPCCAFGLSGDTASTAWKMAWASLRLPMRCSAQPSPV
jgi:hypothetical protein